MDRLPLVHPTLGTWPATQACALTGNQTGDPLVLRPELSPLSHTCQGRERGSYPDLALVTALCPWAHLPLCLQGGWEWGWAKGQGAAQRSVMGRAEEASA